MNNDIETKKKKKHVRLDLKSSCASNKILTLIKQSEFKTSNNVTKER